MPKAHARLWLRVTDTRVERLQVITPEDCVAEGVAPDVETLAGAHWRDQVARDFSTRWDALNAKRGYPWDTNPWVWVVTFERAAAP
jgi:hypothetical protein